METMTEGSVCIFCGKGEARDALPEGTPVHASCVLVGKQLVVTAHLVMERESPVLRGDSRVIAFFHDVACSMNIAWFRERLRHLCAYLTYLRRKFVEYRFAMRREFTNAQVKSDDTTSIRKRLTIARKALMSIRRTLRILQEIATVCLSRPFAKEELATFEA